MPRNPKKKPRKIIDNLDDFSDILINRIADESNDGCRQLLNAIDAAKKRYAKPIESWLTGWIYTFTRLRGSDIESAIKGIEEFPDAYTRIQEFKLLISKGEWEWGSYNHYLFDELIKSVPGYEPLGINAVHLVILRLKELLNTKMDEFMIQYDSNQKLIADRERDKASIQSHSKDVTEVVVLGEFNEAQKLNKSQSSDRVFCLTEKNGRWKITWFDPQNKPYELEPTEELVTVLKEGRVTDLKKISTLNSKRIKTECLKVREGFLNRTELRINPTDPKTKTAETDKALCEKGVTATFVLRGGPNNYSLSWINSLGIASQISLDSYPDFAKWLNSKLNFINEDDFLLLKSHLLQVNTKKSLAVDDFKEDLVKCLTRTKVQVKTPTPESQTTHKLDPTKFANIAQVLGSRFGTLPKPMEEKPRNKLDLEKFKGLEQCLASKLEKKNESLEARKQEAPAQGPSPVTEKPVPKKINLDNFANLALFFGAEPRARIGESAPDDNTELVIKSHL